MPGKHIASRVDPGLPQPDNTLNDELVNVDAVTAPDDSLEDADALAGEAATVSPHDAREAGTGALDVRKGAPPADDEDLVERAVEDGDVLDPDLAAKPERRLH